MRVLLSLLVAVASLAPALADEISRLRGHRVVVTEGGQSYAVEDVAGEGRPLVGLVYRRGDQLWLRSAGRDYHLIGPLARPRIAGPGYKIWVLGEVSGDSLAARRLGVLARPRDGDSAAARE
jgi:hypothetical protein